MKDPLERIRDLERQVERLHNTIEEVRRVLRTPNQTIGTMRRAIGKVLLEASEKADNGGKAIVL
jgi:hypothetical protein